MGAAAIARALVVALAACRAAPEDAGEPLVDLARVDPTIRVALTYATPDNFVGETLYDADVCLLRASVAERLARVQARLAPRGVGLLVWDGYRPLSVQRRMWALVPDRRFVADPARGSRHNRGAAVDVTLVDFRGRPLAMPTAHDDFSERARSDSDDLSAAARANRELLRAAMEAEGFAQLASEWWHFDAPGWEGYAVLDVPVAAAQQEERAR